jgi:hypothetical protein
MILSLIILGSCKSQTIELDILIGEEGHDEPQSIITAKNGYIICGHTTSKIGLFKSDKPWQNGYIIKINLKGNIVWQINRGTNHGDFLYDIAKTKDQNYVAFGSSDDKPWLIKFNEEGQIIQEIKTPGNIIGHAINEDEFGNLYAIGNSYEHMSTRGNDLAVLKYDTDLNLIWKKHYGGSKNDTGFDIEIINNQIILLGNTESTDGDITKSNGKWDLWILSINSNGQIVWTKNIGQKQNDSGSALFYDSGSKSIFVTGYTTTIKQRENILVSKISTSGQIEWTKDFGYEGPDYGVSIQKVNSDLLVYTITNKIQPKGSINLLVIDHTGKKLNDNYFGGNGSDGSFNCPDCLVKFNEEIVFVASVYSDENEFAKNKGQQDIWIKKVKTKTLYNMW